MMTEVSRVSPDYERPEQDVSGLPGPVMLSTNRARQGVLVRGMWAVLAISTVLAAMAMVVVYLLPR
jgi:hypothetical protein